MGKMMARETLALMVLFNKKEKKKNLIFVENNARSLYIIKQPLIGYF